MHTHDDADRPSECGRCRQRSRRFDRAWAHWEYDDAVADALRRIKYGDDFASLRALCRGARNWFASRLDSLPASAPLVPVPAHRDELRDRGFHVPTLALRMLEAAKHPRPIRPRLVKRRRTPRQAGLTPEERRRNVRDVFRDTGGEPTVESAILFDDVMTTGATVDAAGSALYDAGFEKVWVLVLARAPRARDFRPSAPEEAHELPSDSPR